MTGLHLAAYYASVADGATNANVAAANDGILTITNSRFIVPQKAEIICTWTLETTVLRMRLNTPKYRFVGLPSLIPVNNSLTIPSPLNIANFIDAPLPVDPVDEIGVEASQSSGGAENNLTLMLLRFENRPLIPGPIYRLRGTAAITAAAGVWASGSITLDQSLPAGRYAIVGLDVIGTNIGGARLIVPGSAYRPGVPARNSRAQIPHPLFARPNLGIWGEFESVNLPNLEIMCTGANTSQEVYLDVIYLGGTRML